MARKKRRWQNDNYPRDRQRSGNRLLFRLAQVHDVLGRGELNHIRAGEDDGRQKLLDDGVALSTLVLLETDRSTLSESLGE